MFAWILVFACSSTPKYERESLVESFQLLHRPIYGVYQLGVERNEIHELLEHSFTGRALTAEYIRHFTALVHMQREQTAIDIRQLSYNSFEVLDQAPGRVRMDVDWSVGGIVTHKAHKHTRINRYRAVYTLLETAKGWRFSDTRMRNLERIRRADDDEIFEVLARTKYKENIYRDGFEMI